MKIILLLISFVLFFSGCKNYLVYKKLNTTWTDCETAPFASVRLIPFRDGQAMEEAYENCNGCDKPSRYQFDITVLKELPKWLEENDGIKISAVKIVPARYNDVDVARYACRVCNGDAKIDTCQVSGYQTILLKLEVPDSKEGFLYFDFATICPPPKGCSSEGALSDTTKPKMP